MYSFSANSKGEESTPSPTKFLLLVIQKKNEGSRLNKCFLYIGNTA